MSEKNPEVSTQSELQNEGPEAGFSDDSDSSILEGGDYIPMPTSQSPLEYSKTTNTDLKKSDPTEKEHHTSSKPHPAAESTEPVSSRTPGTAHVTSNAPGHVQVNETLRHVSNSEKVARVPQPQQQMQQGGMMVGGGVVMGGNMVAVGGPQQGCGNNGQLAVMGTMVQSMMKQFINYLQDSDAKREAREDKREAKREQMMTNIFKQMMEMKEEIRDTRERQVALSNNPQPKPTKPRKRKPTGQKGKVSPSVGEAKKRRRYGRKSKIPLYAITAFDIRRKTISVYHPNGQSETVYSWKDISQGDFLGCNNFAHFQHHYKGFIRTPLCNILRNILIPAFEEFGYEVPGRSHGISETQISAFKLMFMIMKQGPNVSSKWPARRVTNTDCRGW
ncbi:hypothetical protein AAMO2058_001630900 [Amorphochlora amoebiformis]